MTIDMIKAYLYNYCKNFNSLNNVYLNVKCSKQDIQEIKKVLWQYPTENAELFSQESTKISDKEELLKNPTGIVT